MGWKMRMLLVAAILSLAACHRSTPTAESPTPSTQEQRAERAADLSESTQRHWTFLNRIRQDDALLNEENQLGVVLFSSVKPEQVSAVMDKVMSEMAREFPHEDVTLAGLFRRDSATENRHRAPRRAE